MAQFRASLESKYALHKFVRLRQRYILRNNNKLRLRYVAGSFASCIVFAALIVGGLGGSGSIQNSDIALSSSLQAAHIASELSSRDREAGEAALKSRVSDGLRKASAVIKKPPRPLHKDLKIGRGDTVAGILQESGLTSSEAFYTVKALSKHIDPKKVKPGQRLRIDFKPGTGGDVIFTKMSMNLSPIKTVNVTKSSDGRFVAVLDEKELEHRSNARRAEIQTSLYGSAAKAGIPAQIIAEVIRIYSWDVDFQRDIRRGDKIEVLYETEETEDGEFARYGDVLYANLSVGGKAIPIYRYEMKDGRVDYFESDGYSIRKTLMKTPVDGARISSGFGLRKHPVLGYNKMHKGIDFAAPTGTPIYAAGDGIIDYIGRKGGYGNYVRIRHNSKLKTAYAHMHKFGRGMTNGKRVEQGDIIGYIGTTGRSTGPHLHYEVHMNGKQVNPKSVDLPTGEQLTGDAFNRFKGLMGAVYQQYVALSDGLTFAERAAEKKKNRLN